jgi:hypothetical protein
LLKEPRECRSLVLDEDKDWRVVSCPYFKFFDFNDKKYFNQKDIDLTTAKVYEKIDGSTAILYHYSGEWYVGSTSIPDGSAIMCQKTTPTTMKALFWGIFNAHNYKLPGPEDQNKCFIFEVVTPKHIIIVDWKEENLFLTGVRDRESLLEERPEIYGPKYDWKVVKECVSRAKSIEELS